MEPIISLVGFLGAGKTSVLKQITQVLLKDNYNPYIILNDYENANIDAQDFLRYINKNQIKPLMGSCICCDGIDELRQQVNNIPTREKGITLIEANGTTDTFKLMGFLGVGLNERYSPPMQVSVVDVNNWQCRKENHELKANQIQISSLIILTHVDQVNSERESLVVHQLKKKYPLAKIITLDEFSIDLLGSLPKPVNRFIPIEHSSTHWASCSIDIPSSMTLEAIEKLVKSIPDKILRVKGVTRVNNDGGYSLFERTADGTFSIKEIYGEPTTGTKLLTIGIGSNPDLLNKLLSDCI